MELQEIRNEIDRLDKQIQSLFEERMLLCQDVARYKKAHHMPVFQAGREQQILDRVEQNAKEGLGLASRISNVVPNFTQFICITKDMQVAENASVISVMLSISNEPGSLSRILNKFFLYGLDMTKIESRPIRDGSFDVVFHIDFKGNLRDRSIAAFLNDLCKSCRDFKLLGNAVVMV